MRLDSDLRLTIVSDLVNVTRETWKIPRHAWTHVAVQVIRAQNLFMCDPFQATQIYSRSGSIHNMTLWLRLQSVAVGYVCAHFDKSMTIGTHLVSEYNNLKLGTHHYQHAEIHRQDFSSFKQHKMCLGVLSNFSMIKKSVSITHE